MKVIDQIYKNLHVRKYECKENLKGVIVALHGFAGDKDSSVICALAREMCEYNYHLISFDLPNHGENNSDKSLKLNDCFKALKDIDDLVKKEYGDYKISYFATSFGGYLLLNLLSGDEYKYDKIILRAPAVDMDSVLANIILPEHGYSLEVLKQKDVDLGYEKPLVINYDFYSDLLENNLRKKYENSNFLYVIQGKKDDVINYKNNEDFFKEKCDQNYKMYYFEDADHRFKNPGELEKIVEISKHILIDK